MKKEPILPRCPLRFPSLRGTADIGSVLLKKKKYAEAIEYYNKILGNSPDNFDAWYNIASAYLGTQAYGDAMECINKAIDLRPNDKDTLKLRDIIDHYL